MRKILVVGSGKSTSSLFKYFVDNAEKENWQINVIDLKPNIPEELLKSTSIKTFSIDIKDTQERQKFISEADIVISMLPAFMHIIVAKDCLQFKKNLVTASYVSEELKKLESEVLESNLIFMNEIGLDPGIDHLSAMKMIEELKEQGMEITAFESFTGGLVAPDSEKANPWKYKFTWNPRNVVLAGQGSAVKFIQEGKYKYIPYHKLFRRTEYLEIDNYGRFQGYANRDSLKYIDMYGLKNVKTFFRGTLRRPGFCRAWDMFVQLGMTDDSYIMEDSENMTFRDFINSFLAYDVSDSVELKVQHYLNIDQDSDLMEMLEYLDLFKRIKIGLKNATPAQILQHILERKWNLLPEDKDMVVMLHKTDYVDGNHIKQLQSSMVVIGENQTYTAMAKTVGLPVAIATKLILNGEIKTKGVLVPLTKEIYSPVLAELENYGIKFIDKITQIGIL
ncbi:MAG: saccharopine dehydrogenase C-terminal domain-containing protein [Candidatus Sericytochromatia bacterium]